MKEHAKSKVKQDDRSLFDEGLSSEAAQQKFKHSTKRFLPGRGNLKSNWKS